MISSTLLSLVATALAAQSAAIAEPKAAVATGITAQNWVDYGLDIAAIQIANYRVADLDHKDATEIARNGLKLYAEQAPIKALIEQSLEFIADNVDTVRQNGYAAVFTPEANLKAVQAFASANLALGNEPGFSSLNDYVSSHLGKFDLGAAMGDLQNLVRINPTVASQGAEKVRAKIDENQEAYSSATDMAKQFAEKYHADAGSFRNNMFKLVNLLY